MSSGIPRYALYGDRSDPGEVDTADGPPAWLGMVHCEPIHERSSMHGYRIDPHVHAGLIQVLLLTQGEGEVLIDGATTRLRAPGLVVVPTRHVHGFRFSPDVDGPVVTAAQQPLESLAAVAAPAVLVTVRRPRACSVAGTPRLAEALMPLFAAIARESRLHVRGEGGAGTALLLALFVQIERIVRALPADGGRTGREHDEGGDAPGRSRPSAQVERFLALVDARFHERLTLADYADALGISAGQLSRLCREVRGESALGVINARVVHEAERELVYSTLSVKQVAARLGFEDEAYFGRFFKKHTGRTPTAFRAAAQRQLAPERVSG